MPKWIVPLKLDDKKTPFYANWVQSEKVNRYLANSTRLSINIHYSRKFYAFNVMVKDERNKKTLVLYDLQTTSDVLTSSFYWLKRHSLRLSWAPEGSLCYKLSGKENKFYFSVHLLLLRIVYCKRGRRYKSQQFALNSRKFSQGYLEEDSTVYHVAPVGRVVGN